MPKSLWPESIASPTAEKAPVVILREQAVLLGQKTGNVVEGYVTKGAPETFRGEDFIYEFWLKAPVLDYRVRLLRVEHPIEFYPLTLSVERTGQHVRADDEESFLNLLSEVFSSADTVKMIQSLVAQSTA